MNQFLLQQYLTCAKRFIFFLTSEPHFHLALLDSIDKKTKTICGWIIYTLQKQIWYNRSDEEF